MEKISRETPDLTQENIAKIAALFPDVVTEATDADGNIRLAIDFDALRDDLSGEVVDGPRERYQFTWPGKREAKLEARRPIKKIMRPCPEKSKDWDTTENLYIEGDNLEALKIMRETYAGKVKLIYIDPPYNTGSDFVYADDFSISAEEYRAKNGDFDDEGNRLVKNAETRGRFHSDWCSMMYPRLLLARDLLCDNGAVFISIDDNEVDNLRKMLDELFGAENHLSTLVWEKTRKNDSRFFSNGHEYVCVYAKNRAELIERNTYWREDKPGADEIADEYRSLCRKFGDNYDAMERELKQYYRNLPKDHPAKKYSRYSHIDESGIWRDDNMSWPGGGGPRYEVIHPITGKPCAVPQGGWRFSSPQKMKQAIAEGKVVFREDETQPPIRKTFLIRKYGRFSNEEGIGKQVMGSYFYRSSLQASNVMDDLFGAKVFEYPKDHEVLKRFIKYVMPDEGIVLDFFSGSGSTAHAVLEANEEDGKHRRFIMVQLPEKCFKDTVAFAQGYPTICEIGEERIRRAGAQIQNAAAAASGQPVPDIGFRVLRVDESCLKDEYATPEQYEQASLDLFADNSAEDALPLDLLFQVLPAFRIEYSAKIVEREIGGKACFDVNDGQLIACFDEDVDTVALESIAKERPLYAVFRDACFSNDAAVANLEELFKTFSPDPIRKVI